MMSRYLLMSKVMKADPPVFGLVELRAAFAEQGCLLSR